MMSKARAGKAARLMISTEFRPIVAMTMSQNQ
jgi:hypothetical protein